MKKTIILLLVFSFYLLPSPAHAQSTVMRLSLEEAQQYAVEHNYALQNAALNVKKAEATRWQTLSTMLPQVKAGFDYQNMCGYEMNFGGRSSVGSMLPDSITIGGQTFAISFPSSGNTEETSTSIPMNPSGTFSITASIALTGAQIIGTMLNDIAINMANISHSQSEFTTRTNVKTTYTSILIMEQTVKLLDTSLMNMQQLLATTEASVLAGASEQITADKCEDSADHAARKGARHRLCRNADNGRLPH